MDYKVNMSQQGDTIKEKDKMVSLWSVLIGVQYI